MRACFKNPFNGDDNGKFAKCQTPEILFKHFFLHYTVTMQEILDEVLKTEEEAEEAVKAAHAKGAALKQEAETAASETIRKARQKARELIHEGVASEKEEAERKRKEALKKAEEDQEAFFKRKKDAIEEAADSVVEIIIRIDVEPDG